MGKGITWKRRKTGNYLNLICSGCWIPHWMGDHEVRGIIGQASNQQNWFLKSSVIETPQCTCTGVISIYVCFPAPRACVGSVGSMLAGGGRRADPPSCISGSIAAREGQSRLLLSPIGVKHTLQNHVHLQALLSVFFFLSKLFLLVFRSVPGWATLGIQLHCDIF